MKAMIHQPHTLLLATLHLVHLNETYFRWTTFKLSEVCNWLFPHSNRFHRLLSQCNLEKISTLLDMGLPLRETYVRESWGPQIPPRISEFYFPHPPLPCLFVCFLGFSVDSGSETWCMKPTPNDKSAQDGWPFLHPSSRGETKPFSRQFNAAY